MIKPNASVVISTTPMWTGLMLPASVSAFTNGMKIMMVGTGSMKSPTTVKSATINNIIKCGSWPAMPVIQSAITIAPRR